MNKSKKNNCPQRRRIRDCLPSELDSGPMMEVCSNREITIDGCRGITEYSEYTIKISTSHGVIAIEGKKLNIKYLSVSSVVIEGIIKGIEFVQ